MNPETAALQATVQHHILLLTFGTLIFLAFAALLYEAWRARQEAHIERLRRQAAQSHLNRYLKRDLRQCEQARDAARQRKGARGKFLRRSREHANAQGSNAQGSNAQGGNAQGGNAQGANAQGANDQGAKSLHIVLVPTAQRGSQSLNTKPLQ